MYRAIGGGGGQKGLILDTTSNQIQAGGIWEPIAANFPSLALLFQCNEATGQPQVNDIMVPMAVDLAGANVVTNNGDGTLTLGGTGNALIGALPNPTGKFPVMILSCKATGTNSAFRIGSVTAGANTGVQISPQAGQSTDVNTSIAKTSIVHTRVPDGNAVTFVARWEFGNAAGANASWMDNSYIWNPYTSDGDLTPEAAGFVGAFSASVSIGIQTKPAMCSLWLFTTLPTFAECKVAAAWQHRYAFSKFNNVFLKAPYPGFKAR